jgi:hypothetical protein
MFYKQQVLLGPQQLQEGKKQAATPLPWLLGWCRSATAPYLLIISSRSSLSLLCFTLFTPHPPPCCMQHHSLRRALRASRLGRKRGNALFDFTLADFTYRRRRHYPRTTPPASCFRLLSTWLEAQATNKHTIQSICLSNVPCIFASGILANFRLSTKPVRDRPIRRRIRRSLPFSNQMHDEY